MAGLALGHEDFIGVASRGLFCVLAVKPSEKGLLVNKYPAAYPKDDAGISHSVGLFMEDHPAQPTLGEGGVFGSELLDRLKGAICH